MTEELTIEKVDNGYIVRYNGKTRVHENLDRVLDVILLAFEDRAEYGARNYGKITIDRDWP